MNVTVPTDGAADPYGLVGSVVGGHRVELLLDTNGAGLVYRAASMASNERVALKVLRPTADADRAAMLARFADEMRGLPALAEGNADIVALRAFGEVSSPRTGETLPFLVSDWVDGTLLSTHLAERRERKMPGRGLHDALDLVETAVLAVAHAHAHGIVHRDLRPSNLILARLRNGTHLKVLDFGVAQSLGTFPPEYAGPEQISHRALVGPWTDIRALTVVILEVMTGDRPRDPQGLVPTLGLPRALGELFLRALAEDPHERPAHAGFFWSTIRELTRTHVESSIALAPTDADEASARVRAMRAEIASRQQGSTPSPFTGTMLMVGGPNGAIRALDVEEAPGSTAPLAMPAVAPASAPSEAESGHAISPHAMSIGLASPLASSIGIGGPTSPLSAGVAGGVTFAMPAVAPQMHLPTPQPFSPPTPQSVPPPNLAYVPHGLHMPTSPVRPSAPPPASRAGGRHVFLLGLAVGIGGTVAILTVIYWFILRQP